MDWTPNRWKRYPKYRDSGVEWLGEVPEQWRPLRMDAVAEVEKAVVTSDALTGRNVYHYSIPVVQELGSGQVEDGDTIDSNKILVTRHVVLISKLNPRKSTIVAAMPHDEVTVCSGEFIPLVPKKCEAKYLEYVCRCEQVRQLLSSCVESVTRSHQRVDPAEVTKLGWIWPTLHEQRVIADFLDRETGRIDALIAKKDRQIELLQEKRQALITHAVTKGLDPKAKMKDTGVAWLGEIPDSWKVKRLRHLVQEPLMYGANESADEDDPTHPRYLRITDFDDLGRLREDTFKSLPMDKARPYLLRPGAVLFARSGATVGKTFQFKNYRGQACFAGYLVKAQPNEDRMSSDYLYLFTRSVAYESWRDATFSQATIQNIGADKYQDLRIPVPPLKDQDVIVDFLRRAVFRIDALTERVDSSIALLREYRTALISAAVTGKIDVRKEELA